MLCALICAASILGSGGGAAPAVCYVPPKCEFRFSEPYLNLPGSGGAYTVGIYSGSTGSDCQWTATAESIFKKIEKVCQRTSNSGH